VLDVAASAANTQYFSGLWHKHFGGYGGEILSAATIADYFHKAGIMPQDTEECESENDCDSNMVNNWQHLYQKIDVTAEVALNSFIDVDSDASVV
jgi:hypothetical protein